VAEPAGGPLRIKAPTPASGARELAAGIVLFGPVLAYFALGLTGRPLHLADPLLNRLAHGLVLLVPFVWASALLGFPVKLRDDPRAAVVDAGPFHAFDRNWFQGALTLPGLALGVLALGAHVAEALALPNEQLATSGWTALLFSAEAFLLVVVYGTAAGTQRWLGAYDEGLQVDVARTHPWEDVVERGRRMPGPLEGHDRIVVEVEE